jgi:carboxyl-terminal processing protease
LIVLINNNSASASEIVAGALQDHDRALIVGETSFGKALVQTIFPLEGNRGLALTTGKYYTPSERLIQRDYSNSFYDYYNNRDDHAGRDREQHLTDAGRVVFGGGGITPDIVTELERESTLVRRLRRKDVFREFASKLSSGEMQTDIRFSYSSDEIESMSPSQKRRLVESIQISPETLELFKDLVSSEEVEYSLEEFQESEPLIKNLLRRELVLPMFGDEESHRIQLEMDRQVQVALEQLPQARRLLAAKAQ